MARMMTAIGYGELLVSEANLPSLTRGDRIIRDGRLCDVTDVRFRPQNGDNQAMVSVDTRLVGTGDPGPSWAGVAATVRAWRVLGARGAGGMR